MQLTAIGKAVERTGRPSAAAAAVPPITPRAAAKKSEMQMQTLKDLMESSSCSQQSNYEKEQSTSAFLSWMAGMIPPSVAVDESRCILSRKSLRIRRPSLLLIAALEL